MPQIFISYGRADEVFCRTLSKDLDESGGDIWIDVDDIRAGEDWAAAIQTGLDACSVMILVISPASMQSRRVREEWKYFHSQDKPLIPLLLEPTPVSYELHSLQYVNFHTQRYDIALKQLISELARTGAQFTKPFAQHIPLPVQPPLPTGQAPGPLAMIRPPLLQSKAEYNRIENMIANIKQEVWISGISLNKVAPYRTLFSALLNQNKKARFMLVNPNNAETVKETSDYVGQETDLMWSRLTVCLNDLCKLQKAYPALVEIRLMNWRPSVGYFISDPDSEQGVMTVSPYFYQIDRINEDSQSNPCCDPPFLHLPQLTEKQWFDVYRQDFERMWSEAQPWECANGKK
ncbi:MAG: toll/interleukin-1 receptor domain-containing protein [Chloroflexi bacterium]|nr:toll/interleukin-1 receptor domain-containing protein [Chloroflexota bacterium]